MSSTRFRFPTKTPTKSFFTMAELIAVMAITAVLLTITINIMKTDSTKANAQIVGSAVSFGQSYAMSQTCFVIIKFTDENTDSVIDTITVYEAENTGTVALPIISIISTNPIQKQNKLAVGSKFSAAPADIYFSATGEPITTTNRPITSTTTMNIIDDKNADTKAVVNIKPFNGKITYY